MKEMQTRGSGILLPIFSLPSPYGIGTMGSEARRFVDFLKKGEQKYWQILPVGQTSYGDSPYQSFSVHAGNPYFIDLDLLKEDGLLESTEYSYGFWGDREDTIDYAMLYEKRYDISKLYIYKARYGISIEIPINLRGVNPLDVINTITKVETGQVSPSRGIEIVKSMLKEELEPKKKDLEPKVELKSQKIKKVYKFKLKKVFVCNETNEVFNRVIDANEKYGFSKNTIYKCLEGSRKYSTSKYGTKLTWRVMYSIIL